MNALNSCRIYKGLLWTALPCEELEVKMQMKLYQGVIPTNWEGLCHEVLWISSACARHRHRDLENWVGVLQNEVKLCSGKFGSVCALQIPFSGRRPGLGCSRGTWFWLFLPISSCSWSCTAASLFLTRFLASPWRTLPIQHISYSIQDNI